MKFSLRNNGMLFCPKVKNKLKLENTIPIKRNACTLCTLAS